ncbi:MAG TPA: hypothetical protein VF939_23980 [Puia sp.]
MRNFLFLLSALIIGPRLAYSQDPCRKKSSLFKFDASARPRVFTEKLGNHPQFPFLQSEKGVNTRSLFLQAAKDPENRKNYKKEFAEFNELLKDIGFTNGYKSLPLSRIENLYINPGTIGNLGFYNKEYPLNSYIYVKLNPAGEEPDGVAAWKITGPTGCYVYILHTCGNAFYPSNAVTGAGCCREILLESMVIPLDIEKDTAAKPLHVKIGFYQARVVATRRKGKERPASGLDTVYKLVRSIDTLRSFKDDSGGRLRIYANTSSRQFLLCRDTVLRTNPRLLVDSSALGKKPAEFTLADTSFVREDAKGDFSCHKKWEIALDGGASYNAIPRFDNTTQHSRTDGAHGMAELAISRIFSHWFQAGISASYITLSYQDDIAYPGSVAGTYNTVYLGKPIIPLQLFGKATIGGPLHWQSNVSLSAGYSIPTKGKIVNSGNTLTTSLSVKGGLTAGFKLGIAYFFSCKFGIGLSFDGQYFNNKGASMNYHLVAMPITLGIRYRF